MNNWNISGYLSFRVEANDKALSISILPHDKEWIVMYGEVSNTPDMQLALDQVRQGLSTSGMYPTMLDAIFCAEAMAEAYRERNSL